MLHGLTGLVAGDRQAALIINEVKELRAQVASEQNRSVGQSMAAYKWLGERYQPVTQKLREALGPDEDLTELYCQVLEHKWYLSERAKRDVGLDAALDDYLVVTKQKRDAAGGHEVVGGGTD